MLLRRLLLLCIPLLIASTVLAVGTPIPPAPTRWVTDEAGFMTADAVRSLDRQIGEYSRATGQQVIVYIGKTTGGVPIDDWAVRAFEAWKVGQKGLDNGLALFLFAEDKSLRIEVGYGLEGKITDALSSQIINDVIVPKIRAGDAKGAVFAGVSALVQALGAEKGGSPSGQTGRQGQKPVKLTIGHLILFGILAVGFIILLITNPTLAMFLLISILSGGRGGGGRGGFGGGGGGFSGGGGRSGGGGASGSW